jgi:hypothetical protein
MPSLVTLAELRERVRLKSDTDKSKHITDKFLNGTINGWCKQLYNRLTEITPRYYAISTSFPSVAGQADYLPHPDFFRLSSLQVQESQRVCPVRPWQYGQDQADLRSLPHTPSVWGLYYQLTARGITILPTPNTDSWTFLLDYIPTYQPMLDDEHTFDSVNGFEEWVVYKSCVDVAMREESEWKGFDTSAAELEEHIARLADPDPASPPTIKDVRPRRRGYWYMP